MSERLNPPIQLAVGYGKLILGTWIDDTAIWISNYYPNPNEQYEEIQFERGAKNLRHRFNQYKLIEPQINLISPDDTEIIDPFTERQITAAASLLSVTTHLMPYVDYNYIRPIRELGMPPPQPDTVEYGIVAQALRAGGIAICDTFGSAMLPRKI